MYKKSVETNTVEKYEEFLQKYPDSKYQSEVKEKIIELEFSNARSKNTISAFKTFLQKYPDNKYKGETITVIDQLENELWHEVKRLNTNLSYISYFLNFARHKG
jgi:outer membrane protein assembly factor BamD (BamD/ComL family)